MNCYCASDGRLELADLGFCQVAKEPIFVCVLWTTEFSGHGLKASPFVSIIIGFLRHASWSKLCRERRVATRRMPNSIGELRNVAKQPTLARGTAGRSAAIRLIHRVSAAAARQV